jgi:type II secretory pathway pseudopilin PulG
MVGLIAGDPAAVCEDSTEGACLISVGSLVGTAIVAILTTAIAFGQYYAGQRQAHSAERQAQLAAVPLLDKELLALQRVVAFGSGFDWHCSRFAEHLDTIQKEISEPTDHKTLYILSKNALRLIGEITKITSNYFDEVQVHIIPEHAEPAHSALVAAGEIFSSGAGNCSYFMEVLVGEDEDNDAVHRHYAIQKLRESELERARKACNEARMGTAKALREIKGIVIATRALRTKFLGPLASSAAPML